jgi:hypothetical protein
MQLTEEIINNFTSKEYRQYRKEIKEFYRLQKRNNYISILTTPMNLLTQKERKYKKYKELKRKCPWILILRGIIQRCNNINNVNYNKYGGRGIKNHLTKKQIKFLWFRDKAYLMKRPSIDRINNNGDYKLNNCCFIETAINAKKGSKLLLTYDKTV